MKDLNERMRTARKLIEEHDNSSLNFYTFAQRMLLLGESGNYMAAMADLNDPMQVGDAICALDNARIPFEFRPEVSAKLWRLKQRASRRFNEYSVLDDLTIRPKTVDEYVRDLVLDIMENGVDSETRTGVRSRAVNSRSYTVDISMGQLPSISTKFNWNFGIKGELLWMLSGDTNVRFLKKHKIGIWDSWVKASTAEYRHLSIQEISRSFHDAGLLVEFITYFANLTTGEMHRTLKGIVAEHTGKDTSRLLALFDAIVGTIADDSPLIDKFYTWAEQMGVATQYMTAGELPKIYQHQWRRWNDTRILEDNHEFEAYMARGFEVMGSIDNKTVVRR